MAMICRDHVFSIVPYIGVDFAFCRVHWSHSKVHIVLLSLQTVLLHVEGSLTSSQSRTPIANVVVWSHLE